MAYHGAARPALFGPEGPGTGHGRMALSPVHRGGPGSGGKRLRATKPDVVVAVRRVVVVALGAAQVGGVVVPRTAPQHPVRQLRPIPSRRARQAAARSRGATHGSPQKTRVRTLSKPHKPKRRRDKRRRFGV